MSRLVIRYRSSASTVLRLISESVSCKLVSCRAALSRGSLVIQKLMKYGESDGGIELKYMSKSAALKQHFVVVPQSVNLRGRESYK